MTGREKQQLSHKRFTHPTRSIPKPNWNSNELASSLSLRARGRCCFWVRSVMKNNNIVGSPAIWDHWQMCAAQHCLPVGLFRSRRETSSDPRPQVQKEPGWVWPTQGWCKIKPVTSFLLSIYRSQCLLQMLVDQWSSQHCHRNHHFSRYWESLIYSPRSMQ